MALTKVKTGQIGTDVIVAEDIAANAITVSELQDNAVTAAKLYVTGNGTSGQAPKCTSCAGCASLLS